MTLSSDHPSSSGCARISASPISRRWPPLSRPAIRCCRSTCWTWRSSAAAGLDHAIGGIIEQACAKHFYVSPFIDRTLLRALLAHPLMTFKIMAAIHWEALRLWRKSAKFQKRPAAPPVEITYGPGLVPATDATTRR